MTDLPKAFQEYALSQAQLRLLHAEHFVDKYWPADSPIERLFMIAFWLVGGDAGGVIYDYPPPGYTDPDWFFVKPQAPILNYRADFLIGLVEFPNAKGVVVECDGHDYHERTKEQAAHDRKRDREMQSAGYKVFRFTGSELHRDAFKCAEEVVNELFGIHHRNSEGRS
jgi:very-short-patch-repair endonuclease